MTNVKKGEGQTGQNILAALLVSGGYHSEKQTLAEGVLGHHQAANSPFFSWRATTLLHRDSILGHRRESIRSGDDDVCGGGFVRVAPCEWSNYRARRSQARAGGVIDVEETHRPRPGRC